MTTPTRLTLLMCCLLVALGLGAPALADSRPADPTDPRTPPTVTADGLPTVQINGVVWSQTIVGTTVYVAGNFTNARPAGAAPNTSTTPRSHLLAYDIRTGNLIGGWAPSANAQVRSVTASPDGSRIYVGGDFTAINGQPRNRLAALDPATGAPLPWTPNVNGPVRSLAATASTVYAGGQFTAIGGQARTRVGAVSASNGTPTGFAPTLTYGDGNGHVWALALSPDRARVAIGGAFVTVNGSSNPGYGLAMLDGTTGALLPMPANAAVRDAGLNAAITSMASDGDSLYVGGYHFGAGGNLEGTARIRWSDGALVWVEDCHGDTYGVWPVGDVVYKVSHAHYCGNLPDGPGQTDPWTYHWGLAVTKASLGTIGREKYSYANWEGRPSPWLLRWLPRLTQGAFTGANQAAWTVTGNADYVLFGGEFPRAGTLTGGAMAHSQGLVRYARPGLSRNKVGPEIRTAETAPSATVLGGGVVRVGWPANWDRDQENLTYQVVRDGAARGQVVARSSQWNRPRRGWTDTGVAAGSHTYRVDAVDPDGNVVQSTTTTVQVPSGGAAPGAYARRVLDDGPALYWRLGETSGPAIDAAAWRAGTVVGAVTRGQAGAVGDGTTAATFNGSSGGVVAGDGSTAQPAQQQPNALSLEAWFRTSTTRGGMIWDFGSARTGGSGRFDRALYMTNNGRLAFMLRPSDQRTITSPGSYNNGQWHHVVATVGTDGSALFVDGVRVAGSASATQGSDEYGYWRLGGDSTSGLANRPASGYFAGTLDEAALYPRTLSAATIAAHHTAGRGGTPGNAAPTASFTATTDGLTASFDGSGSSDADGTIQGYAWTFGDGSSATGARASHTYASTGQRTVTLTVTDDDGATGSVSRIVSVAAPGSDVLAGDEFAREQAGGWGSADTGGAWTTTGSSSIFSVAGGTGRLAMPAGQGPRANLTAVSSAATDVSVRGVVDVMPSASSIYATVTGRVVGPNEYRAKLRMGSDGTQSLALVRLVGSTETTIATTSVAFPATAGTPFTLRLRTTGTAPTQLAAKVWRTADPEPSAWMVTGSDGTSGLQTAGGVGLAGYLSSAVPNGPLAVRFDGFRAVPAA